MRGREEGTTDEGEGRGDHRRHTKGQNQRCIVTKQWN